MTTLRIPPEEVRRERDRDLVVVGGGSAGVAAAVTAARLGLQTLLVEEMPFLGGMSTGGCVGTYCGFYLQERDGSLHPTVGGLPLEIADTLLARRHAYGPIAFRETAALPYVPWGVKLLLEELARAEARLEVWLHARVTHAVVEGARVSAVVVDAPSGRRAVAAPTFVDASGDASLARLAGVETILGDEIQFPSMMFTMQNVDLAQAIANLARLPQLLEARFESDGLPRKSGNLIPTGRPGEVLVALSRMAFEGRPLNATETAELTWGEMEGRVQAARLGEFLRRHMPGFQEAFVADSAPRLGVRETRKIVGELALQEDDVVGRRHFEDGIGRCAWPIERHVAGGETRWTFLEPGTWYTIPYRCLVPRGIENLLAAGRCISADPGAFASVRVIGPCMLEGQAAAVAAHQMAAGDGAARAVDVEKLRSELGRLGVPL